MENVEFRKLTQKDENAYNIYIGEFLDAGEEVIPRSIFKTNLSFKQWLKQRHDFEKGINLPVDRVKATTFFLIRKHDGKILGALDLRHELTEHLLKFGGNIGYGVAPSERKKGYANYMLATALPICKGLGLEKVLITCNKENTGSARTIQKNGGVLENEVDYDGVTRQRYWIDLNSE
ncbi:MAG: GNAT family N-acetyltransferase [Patescibacteria group bacterium]|jgi:predicted acetyltransferase